MENIKLERLNHTFIKEISLILELEIKDELIKFITITDVDITNDLSYAKVYFTALDEDNKEEITKTLNNASSFIRKCLSKKVEVRHTPQLKFIYDESIEYGKNIEKVIENIEK